MWIVFIAIILGTAVLLSWPLGKSMTWTMNPGGKIGGVRGGAERLFEKTAGKVIAKEQTWKEYVLSMLLFNGFMFIVVFAILAMQQVLPLNPDVKGALSPDLIFHTVASFTSNTNLQHYSGEVSLSYFSQIFGLMWLQFVSAATGIAALTALARGLAGKTLARKLLSRSHAGDLSRVAATGRGGGGVASAGRCSHDLARLGYSQNA